MKKRFLATVILLLFLLGAFGCEKKDDKKTDTADERATLYEQGLDIVSLMTEMACSDAYAKLYSSSPKIQEILETVESGDFSKPQAVYKLTYTEKSLFTLVGMKETEALSKPLKDYLYSKLLPAAVSHMNSISGGTTALAAASVCNVTKTFVNNSVSEDMLYLYIYKDAPLVAVSFVPGEDGAVSAIGSFIFHKDVPLENEQDVRDFLKGFFLEVASFEEITK